MESDPSQMATWRAGLLVLSALALVSEWMLVGTVIGCAIGTVLGRLCARGNLHAWYNGMDGFNPAILGIIGAGAFAAFSADLGWIIAAMVFVVGVDQVIRSSAVSVRMSIARYLPVPYRFTLRVVRVMPHWNPLTRNVPPSFQRARRLV